MPRHLNHLERKLVMGRKGAQEEAVVPRFTGSGLLRAGATRALRLLAGETLLSAAPDQADLDGAVRQPVT
jgi:hypothetical protein